MLQIFSGDHGANSNSIVVLGHNFEVKYVTPSVFDEKRACWPPVKVDRE